ncbi:hypothetical protein Misp01_03870 [Microtetraspora sp. NBRC 13810]|uniref:hypothetical protein n=1 Tax=Microtetraspora sp. NBRC 13810 TaxID=3030990 RepID=UPI0024A330B1|nr:hypothetical protein [Microtetraspora sp. NBRC 13810]GLW05257.1 hypothetical protein Misp01_03870 [Microtetraspora sp. NBRC 13810]
MSEPHIDPSGSTQQFRAFAQQNEQETAKQRPSYVLPITAAVILVVIVAVGAYLLLA